MRRTGSFLSIGLVMLGLELSTKSVSLSVTRISSGLSALSSGVGLQVSPTRFVVGIVVLVVGLVLAALMLWVMQAEGGVSAVGDGCPACGGDTSRVKRRASQKVLSLFMGQKLTRRRCEACGWGGLSVRY